MGINYKTLRVSLWHLWLVDIMAILSIVFPNPSLVHNVCVSYPQASEKGLY